MTPPRPAPRLLIVGGGVSGLAAATFARAAGWDPLVLEAAPTAGGKVQTLTRDGWCLDAAANGWLDNEPAMARLLALAGLTGAVQPAGPASRTRWIWRAGRAHPAPLSPPAFLATRLLSWGAKLRVLLEPFIRPGPPGADESVAAFVRRRLGPAFVDALVGPMVTGIYAGDAEAISLPAAFPRMAALEARHGSLVRALLALRRGGAPAGRLETLRGGAGALPAALAAALGPAVRTGAPVTALHREDTPAGPRWRVTGPGLDEAGPAALLACPAAPQAQLLRPLAPAAAAALGAMATAPVAVVALGYAPGALPRPPEGFGVLLARGEALPGAPGALGVLYSSNVFPDCAPAGHTLVRVILGGALHPAAATAPPADLAAQAQAAVAALCGGPATPALTHVFVHPDGIPQYTLGHPARLAALRAAVAPLPQLGLLGNHLDGIGVKDCARAAEAAVAALGPPPA